MKIGRLMPWVVAVLSLAAAVMPLVRSAPAGEVDWEGLARLPISADGRVKPLDTFARNSLMVLSGRQTYEVNGSQRPAIEWIAELLATPDAASDRRVFRIDHPGVVSLLGLESEHRVRFSFREVAARIDEVARQSDLALQTPAKQRDPFQREIVQLENRVLLYARIGAGSNPYAVAPMAAGEEWRPISAAIRDPAAATQPSLLSLSTIFEACSKKDWPTMNAEIAAYHARLRTALPDDVRRAAREITFNKAEPFYRASMLYVAACVLGLVGFLLRPLKSPGWAGTLARCALAAVAVAFVVHTLGLGWRIYLQGRPPVTNLYSSAVFIGWVCIPLALAGEWFYRLGLGTVVGSLIGFGTLVVAHNLSSGGDTMEMMQAVLDSNFWLATHVVVVTVGYSATFLAGFFALVYILAGAATPLLRGEPAKALPKMIYGVICFASIASFVGTVLGGIWADQSWGRFWGWDPKENGAALIVLWNLLILHARWGGMVKERGVAVLAVGGNIVTAWSWFGTNMLGVGLHSYGFMDSAAFWLAGFCVSQLAVMAVGLLPVKSWRSLRPAAAQAARVH